MYYANHDRPQDDFEQPIETTAHPVGEPVHPKKKKHTGVKVVSLALACALLGGFAGAGVTAYLGGNQPGTTIYQSSAPSPLSAVVVNDIRSDKTLTLSQIYATFVGSTVGITTEIVTTNYFGQPVPQAAAGSGFVISADGYIVTNYHVIQNAKSIKVSFVDGTTYDATLVGGEEENDVAVLKIEASGLTPVVIGDSESIGVGEQVAAIGNPLGELTFSLTSGYVSAKDRSLTMSDGTIMNYLQTDTAINSGNSGGPLFNMYGQVIGITSAKLSGSSSSEASIEGLGFAIPMNDVKGMIQDIIAHGYVTGKPYLGITVTTVPESVAQEYGMSQGALVKSVDSNSCAAKAGIRNGDIITSIGGETVVSSAELIEQKKTYKAGNTVDMTIDRDGQSITVSVTFDEDNPQRQSAQQKQLEDQQAQQRQPSQGYGDWPFGNSFPWFY